MAEPLKFVYRNWKGDVALRAVSPLRVYRGTTEWHADEQWLLEAYDLEKKAPRTFALASVVCWPDGPEALAAWLSGRVIETQGHVAKMADQYARAFDGWREQIDVSNALRDEIQRLKSGRFTEEELQALCHAQGEDCPERFARGCVEYNRTLFGDKAMLEMAEPATPCCARCGYPMPQKAGVFTCEICTHNALWFSPTT